MRPLYLNQLVKRTLYLFSLLILASCHSDDDGGDFEESALDKRLIRKINRADTENGLAGFVIPDLENLALLPQDPKNPITPEKVAVGKMLFHETVLATEALNSDGMLTYSCASCHHVAAGMQSGLRQGLSDGGIGFGIKGEGRVKNPLYDVSELDVQPLKSPAVLNVTYQKNMLWNGQFGATGLNVGTEAQWVGGASVNLLGFEGVESQAIKGLEVHRLNTDFETMDQLGYMELLRDAFPGVDDDTLTSRVYLGLAIAAYERTVNASEAPFQQWLKGNRAALTDQEKRGAIVFFGKGNCASCHSGPGLNNMEFDAVGMGDLTGDDIFREDPVNAPLGRASFTGNSDDNYKFKVPQLYNLKDAGFYGHGSSFDNIRDVVQYFNHAIPQKNIGSGALDERFQPLHLNHREVTNLTAFLEEGLYDNNLQRHIPNSLLSGQCFPVADDQARLDLGCDTETD